MKLKEAIMELIYPDGLYCICCGNLIDSSRTYHLCDHCIEHIKWDGSPVKIVDGLRMMKCAEYGIYERTLIFSLKYNGKKYIARDIGKIMADRLSLEDYSFDYIVPVPMFKKKERIRGFNQSALIGKYLALDMGKPCIAEALIRTEDTAAMRGLSPTERAENVKDKFTMNDKYAKMIEGKRILLIDDFYTTGSTAGECAKALRKGGTGEILFLAFAAKK